MPRQDLSKIGVILLAAGLFSILCSLTAAHFSGREAGRFLVREAKGGLSPEEAAGWEGSQEEIRRSVPLVLDTQMNPLKMRLTFRRPKEDSGHPETVYYKSRLIHERGDAPFVSKGTIRFDSGEDEISREFPAFTIPEPGEYTLYSQFRDGGGRPFDSEAVVSLKRNAWSIDVRIIAGALALTAIGAGLFIAGKKENGSREI